MKEIDLSADNNIIHTCERLAIQTMYFNRSTYKKFDEMCKQKTGDDKKKKEEFSQTIPDLVATYTEKGKKYLEGDQLDLWIRMLPSRFGDLYQGMEIGCTLKILEAIKDFEEPSSKCVRLVNDMLEEQGHSGMSYKLMKFMLDNFSKFGPDLTSRLY